MTTLIGIALLVMAVIAWTISHWFPSAKRRNRFRDKLDALQKKANETAE